MAKSKRYGLVLTLGGAPATPHQLSGLPGYYRPDRPTPVGEPGEMSLEQAKELDGQDGAPVKLVEIDSDQAGELVELAQQDIRDGLAGVRAAKKTGLDGAEPEIAADEQKAATAAKNNKEGK